MGDVIFTDIVDVGGRKFRKQSGSIGETIERSQRRRAAERTRAVRVAAEEDGDELFREDDDDDGFQDKSVDVLQAWIWHHDQSLACYFIFLNPMFVVAANFCGLEIFALDFMILIVLS